MYLILLTYTKPLERIDTLLQEHILFLKRHYEKGTFVLSGRMQPRTGGVILAKADSKEALEKVLESDPFRKDGAATYQIIEFLPTMSSPSLTDLLPPKA